MQHLHKSIHAILDLSSGMRKPRVCDKQGKIFVEHRASYAMYFTDFEP
jgi:hypothetical protein